MASMAASVKTTRSSVRPSGGSHVDFVAKKRSELDGEKCCAARSTASTSLRPSTTENRLMNFECIVGTRRAARKTAKKWGFVY